MSIRLWYYLWLVVGFLVACSRSDSRQHNELRSAPEQNATELRQQGNTVRLFRNGQPYFIQGAGGKQYFDRLRACGGNSIRIWDDLDAQRMLDEAQHLQLTVMFGVWVGKEADGFDYTDQVAVDRQFEQIRKTVLKYRHHPALLMWCVGNEWAQDANNFGVFDEVNRIAALIHELDPSHPVATAISPDSGRAIWLVQERCPAVDILAFNVYGILPDVPRYLKEGGWTKPYLISEFGSKGYWEVPHTPWETAIEPTSDQKYTFVRKTYQAYIGSRPPNCLGAYMFYWGSKQEDTHTWFSLFDERGQETALVGLMQELWSKRAPANVAPRIQGIRIDGKITSYLSLVVGRGQHQATVLAHDPDQDSLTYRWEIKPAAHRTADYIDTPIPAIEGLIPSRATASISFSVPAKPGAYRLFVYAYDAHNHVATANVPLLITASTP